ncbi:zinc finger, CCHC-type containing protein [Tanacetum coccineum]
MGDANPIRTLGDYSKPSHEGYRNTIELPVGNNMVPLLSDTIQMVQNRCSFHGLRERTSLRLFQFSLHYQASNRLERLPAGPITTWEDLTTRFLAQFFPPRRTAKLRNDILIGEEERNNDKDVATGDDIENLLEQKTGMQLRKLRWRMKQKIGSKMNQSEKLEKKKQQRHPALNQ